MKSMFKVCFASVGLLFMASLGHAYFGDTPNETVPKGLNWTTVSSSQVVFSKAGTLYWIKLSTGDPSNFVQAFDTVASIPAGGVGLTALNSVTTNTVTSQLVFLSTTAVYPGSYYTAWDAGQYGQLIQNGLYLYINAGGLGTARAIVGWTK